MKTKNVFDFSTFPTLTTQRLVLRELQLSDAADVLVFRGDPYVQRYNGSVYADVAEAEASIKRAHATYQEQEGVGWAVTFKNNNTVMGAFGIHDWSWGHRRAEIGYDLARSYWGQGIASEALKAILRFGFEQMNLNHIYAGTIADNHESVRLLENAGFHRDGIRRKWSWEDDGTFHDGALYSLLQDEFIWHKME